MGHLLIPLQMTRSSKLQILRSLVPNNFLIMSSNFLWNVLAKLLSSSSHKGSGLELVLNVMDWLVAVLALKSPSKRILPSFLRLKIYFSQELKGKFLSKFFFLYDV